jgi:hypothetical protein
MDCLRLIVCSNGVDVPDAALKTMQRLSSAIRPRDSKRKFKTFNS